MSLIIRLFSATPFARKAFHRGRGEAAAKRSELAEARIVDQDQQDVRSALRRLHRLGKLHWVRVGDFAADFAVKVKIGPRQHTWRLAVRLRQDFLHESLYELCGQGESWKV